MPIEVNTESRIFNQEEFHALDYRVMGIIFKMHNEFGRFLDETPFKRAIALECADHSIEPVEQEVRIRVTHGSFTKDYFMDLVFARGLMVEARTVETLAPVHRSQALNYLFLTGMKHGRLVNLRPERVQHEFVSTSLDADARHQFAVVDWDWHDVNQPSAWLRQKFVELLNDWGAFL